MFTDSRRLRIIHALLAVKSDRCRINDGFNGWNYDGYVYDFRMRKNDKPVICTIDSDGSYENHFWIGVSSYELDQELLSDLQKHKNTFKDLLEEE